MDKISTKKRTRRFSHFAEIAKKLDAEAIELLSSTGSDITLLLDVDGRIRDVAYVDSELDFYNPAGWIGQPFAEVVTSECVDKVEALLDDCRQAMVTRRRQVNHAAPGHPDLPVDYLVVAPRNIPWKFALGNDLRPMARMQRQLVSFQLEMETEYRKVREAEARYRTIFHISDQPLLVVSGSDKKIIDANQPAAALFGKKSGRFAGTPVAQLFGKNCREAVADALARATQTGEQVSVSGELNGMDGDSRFDILPYRESGQNNLLIRVHGIGASVGNGKMPSPGGAIIEHVPEAMVIADGHGRVTDLNRRFLDLVNALSRDRVTGRHVNTWVGASSVDLQVMMSRLRDEGHVSGFSTVVRDEIGIQSPATVSASRFEEGGVERFAFMVSEGQRRESVMSLASDPKRRDASDFSELVGRVPLKELIREAADVIEVMCIEAALRQTDNNRASAAELLGLSRQSLYLKLKRHGLEDFDGE